MRQFIAHFLFLLAAWTVTIKFVLPISWALVGGLPILTFVYWDFWWVVHIWLGWALINHPRYLFWLALVASVAECLIVVTKFVLFFNDPQWTMWSMNWFVNKIFVLACFSILLIDLLFHPGRYRENSFDQKKLMPAD